MIDLNKSRIVESDTKVAHSSVTKIDEGQALVSVMENGVETVKPSAGAAGEVFAGVAIGQHGTPTVAPVVQSFVVPAGGTITLTQTPLTPTTAMAAKFSASASTTDPVDVATIQSGAVTATKQIQVVGAVLTFHASDVGKTVVLTYTANLSAAAAALMYGQGVNGNGGLIGSTGKVGVASNVEPIMTSYYDPAIDWAAGGAVKLAANGVFTIGGAGVGVPNARITNVPSTTSPLLGLRILV